MVESGPYTWSSCEGRESRCWLRDFVLVSDKVRDYEDIPYWLSAP